MSAAGAVMGPDEVFGRHRLKTNYFTPGVRSGR